MRNTKLSSLEEIEKYHIPITCQDCLDDNKKSYNFRILGNPDKHQGIYLICNVCNAVRLIEIKGAWK